MTGLFRPGTRELQVHTHPQIKPPYQPEHNPNCDLVLQLENIPAGAGPLSFRSEVDDHTQRTTTNNTRRNNVTSCPSPLASYILLETERNILRGILLQLLFSCVSE